ncbi:microsomal triacylglycerol transfer protein [Leptinotarsa decemlineata]|uniref:microsomal triacylglycerol transfer protein n=1 Tax=Leptinotarsa decemlineata TaxID=7539 RepID=UPI003D30454A
MLPSINSYSILYTLFAWFLGVCYGFVLLSSAAGHFSDVKLFEIGESLRYKLQSTVLLNEKDLTAKNVGFFIDGEVVVDVIWENDNQKVLRIQLKSPQLHIRSRKAPSPDGFKAHTSKLDDVVNKPFLIVWKDGRVEKLLLPKGETLSLLNFKKGIASLFQFQLVDGPNSETDASGKCNVTYSSVSPTKFLKTKTECDSQGLPYTRNLDKILGIEVNSLRRAEYELDSTSTHIESINSQDSHLVILSAKEDLGTHVETLQSLIFIEKRRTETFSESSLEEVIDTISKKSGIIFTQETLLTEKELVQPEDVISFPKQVDNLRNHLKPEYFGTLKPAKVFLDLVNSARSATAADIAKALSSKKNKQIIEQLYDVLGYIQTTECHEAVLKKLHFDKEENINSVERYLWSLSFSSKPNPEIVKGLLKKFSKDINIPEKVKETLILTIASMAQKLSKLSPVSSNLKIIRDVEETILANLEYAKGEEKFMYFRALKNLKSPTTVPILLNYIRNGTSKEGVLSWKALQSFDATLWNEEVLTAAKKTFFQLDRRHDSSSRTFAADILLATKPSDDLLKDMLEFLLTRDPVYEIKQYIFQKIKLIADGNSDFKERVQRLIKSNRKLNNYSGMSPRGLSIALTRRFLTSESSNGSLVTVQEMKSGIVKRGTIDLVMEKGNMASQLLSLGIFSGGLHSFISSDNDAGGEEAADESATAGIELTVMGTQIRPFVFFNGQGELMGHVWSGTASEKTPAFQVLALLQDNLEHIRLSNGFIAKVDFRGATSFDLSGKIEISLWNRNAEGLVQKSAGIVTTGSTSIDTMFVKSQVEFTASIETKLDLQTDIDFSSNIHLCMRLTQPDALFRHNIFKVERIPGSKHKMRISKYKKYSVPGTTYSINKKNNEMCSAIFG